MELSSGRHVAGNRGTYRTNTNTTVVGDAKTKR
jgi:hypothetical protein